MLRVRMRGRRKWTSRQEERSRAPGADVVVGNVVNRGASFRALFALLRNGCSADCERLSLLSSPRQPNTTSGTNDRPSMVWVERALSTISEWCSGCGKTEPKASCVQKPEELAVDSQ